MSLLKKEEFAPPTPRGSKFFPFRIDSFSEGDKSILWVASPETVSMPLKKYFSRDVDFGDISVKSFLVLC